MRLDHLCDVEWRYALMQTIEPSTAGETFVTKHKPHLWLNEVIAIGEGSIDRAAGALSMRYYTCHVEYRPEVLGSGPT